LKLKRTKRETEHSLSSSAEVKGEPSVMERKCSKRLGHLKTFLGHIITSTHTNDMKEDACLEMVGAATNMTGTVCS
jgi:hypothetical protein